MTLGMQQQKAAVQSGQWLLYRYNPDRNKLGENPLHLDTGPPKLPVADYLNSENRFKMLTKSDPSAAQSLFAQAQNDVNSRWHLYQYLAARTSNSHSQGTKP
jgi:pyruvate-ferredoxin/flavodoxin oxidoreductase